MRRRTFLARSGAATLPIATLAGCAGDGGNGGSADADGSNGEGTAASAQQFGDGVALDDAAIARDLAAQPALGPDPSDAESVIFEVTDPSCPTCRSFHGQAFPRIKSELVEPGTTAFVVRNVDWVYDWSDDAARALEAVHDRSAVAYWDLLGHYFDSQSEFTAGNVLDRTATFLAETDIDVDGDAVVADVEAGEYDDAVSADVTAARDAGAQSQPYFFLFKGGEQVTSFQGAQSYDVFRSSLGY